MSKFCGKCGRPLQEGEVCSCQMGTGSVGSGQQYNNQQMQSGWKINQGQQVQSGQQFHGQQINQNQSFNGQQMNQGQQFSGQQYYGQQMQANQQFATQASVLAQNFLGKVLHLVKNPVTAGEELIMQADQKASLLLIVFQGIFSALFAMAAAAKCSQYMKAIAGLAGGMSSGLGSTVAGALSMPYFRIFIVTVLFSLGLASILALLLMLGHMIIKIPVSFGQMLSVAGIRSAVLVPAILLSIIIFQLSAGLGMILFILVNVWGFAAMIVAMSSFVEREKMNLFVLIVSIVILLFVLLTMFAVSKIWTFYLPDVMRTALNGMDKLSGSQLLEEILGNL